MTALADDIVEAAPPQTRTWSAGAAVARVATVLLVATAGVSSLRPIGDPDIFWHLKTGQLILDTHRLPTHDTWSATGPGLPWVPHEWLGELLYTLAYRAGGVAGVAVVRSFLVVVLVGSVAYVASRRLSPGLALLVTAGVTAGTSGGWGERPQLLSFVLLVPTSLYVRRMVAGEVRGWWLVPTVWLWSMVHGLWFLPLLLLGVTGLVAAAERRDLRFLGRLALPGVAALGAVLVLTPAGTDLVKAIVSVGDVAQYVSEWNPLSLRTPYGAGFLLLLLTAIAAVMRSRQRVPWWVLADIGVAVALGFTWTRTTAAASVLLATLICRVGVGLGGRRSDVPRVVTVASLSGAALALVVAGVAAGAPLSRFDSELPARAAAALQAQPDGTVVFNSYGVGAYLLWAAPHTRPVIDQRLEIFPADTVKAYFAARKMQGDWRGVVERSGARFALLQDTEPLLAGMRDVLGWQPVTTDGDYVLLRAPS